MSDYWGAAALVAALLFPICGLMAYRLHLQAALVKEAMRAGLDGIEFDV